MEDKKYYPAIITVMKKCNPRHSGGCMAATRYLCKMHPELRRVKLQVYTFPPYPHRWDKRINPNTYSFVHHEVAITPNGNVIDTQIHQFGFVTCTVPKEYCFTEEDLNNPGKFIFTIEDHMKILDTEKEDYEQR